MKQDKKIKRNYEHFYLQQRVKSSVHKNKKKYRRKGNKEWTESNDI